MESNDLIYAGVKLVDEKIFPLKKTNRKTKSSSIGNTDKKTTTTSKNGATEEKHENMQGGKREKK